MRIMAVTFILLTIAVVPTPGAADHDSSDQYIQTGPGNSPVTLYIDDSFPPMIYRESNDRDGFQRAWDSTSHLGHSNPDQRLL